MDTATTEIYTLSLHDALPISAQWGFRAGARWLWIALAIGGNLAFACALVVHVAVGYEDRKSTRLNSSHSQISYAVFCLKKKQRITALPMAPRPSAMRCVRPPP